MDERTRANRRDWDAKSNRYQAHHGPNMAAKALAWGTWRISEADVGALGEFAGRAILEIGCGGGHFLAASRPAAEELSVWISPSAS